MVYLFAFCGVAVLCVALVLVWFKAQRTNNQLLLENSEFCDWYGQQDLSFKKYKRFLKQFYIVLACMLWVVGFVYSAFTEGVAYTLLVVVLGWFPAFSLAFVVVFVTTFILQVGRCVVFSLRWFFKACQFK